MFCVYVCMYCVCMYVCMYLPSHLIILAVSSPEANYENNYQVTLPRVALHRGILFPRCCCSETQLLQEDRLNTKPMATGFPLRLFRKEDSANCPGPCSSAPSSIASCMLTKDDLNLRTYR